MHTEIFSSNVLMRVSYFKVLSKFMDRWTEAVLEEALQHASSKIQMVLFPSNYFKILIYLSENFQKECWKTPQQYLMQLFRTQTTKDSSAKECFIMDIVQNCQHMAIIKSRLTLVEFIIVFQFSIAMHTLIACTQGGPSFYVAVGTWLVSWNWKSIVTRIKARYA